MLVATLGVTLGATSSVSAQIRVEAFPSSVTASGHPMTVWVTVHNDGNATARLVLGAVRERLEGGALAALEVSGFEIDDERATGPTFSVPAHGSVRLVVFVGDFHGERQRSHYEARVQVCAAEGSPPACAEGDTHVTRAYRDPIRH